VFEDVIKAAVDYHCSPPEDYLDDVMRAIDYFDMVRF
jgi:hypothetical protein